MASYATAQIAGIFTGTTSTLSTDTIAGFTSCQVEALTAQAMTLSTGIAA